LIESPSEEEEEEEEEEEDEREYDEDEVVLFIKRFNKFIKKRRPYKGDKKKSKGRRVCATIMVRMGISLPITHIRGRRKKMRRKRSINF
jgi:hypothetical protein